MQKFSRHEAHPWLPSATVKTFLLYRGLESERSRRSAFLMRAAARDTEIRFCLRDDCWMSNQSSKDSLGRGRHKRIAMDHSDRCRAVRALIKWCLELRITVRELGSFARDHQAMMFSVPSAAGRQVRLTLRGHRKKRRDERQAEHGQQQNGKKSTQWLH
jgi:hypothetical protein